MPSTPNSSVQENFSPTSVCQLNQFKDCTSLLASGLPFLNGDTNDLDNASIKSETESNGSVTDGQPKMTIIDQKPQLSSLANLLNANFYASQSATGKPASPTNLLEQMFLMNSAPGQTAEQPLDLSLHSKKELDLSDINDFNLLTSLYANNDSLAGKIKK